MSSSRLTYIWVLGWLAWSFFVPGSPISLQSGQQDSAIAPKRRIPLFVGRDLDHFYTYLRSSKYDDPKKVFTVQNGLIRISGEEWGGLTTRDSFRDYHLIVEWKWGEQTFEPRKDKARDSGILVHGVGPDGAAYERWLQSIECQIMEGASGDFNLIGSLSRPSLTVETRTGANGELYWHKGGTPVTRDRGRFNWFGKDAEWKNVLGFRGRADIENPRGEWNRMEILCEGDKITSILNGVIVNEGSHASQTQGKIQIQAEGAELFIRQIELLPLTRT